MLITKLKSFMFECVNRPKNPMFLLKTNSEEENDFSGKRNVYVVCVSRIGINRHNFR